MNSKLHNIPMPKRYSLSANLAINLTDGWSVSGEGVSEPVIKEYESYLKLRENATKHINLELTERPEEGYRIDLQEDKITVQGGSEQALRYALYTLLDTSKGLKLPTGYIEDEPLLQMRGYQLNVHTLEKMNIQELLLMVRWAAEAKLNTLLIEYGTRFPYEKYPNVRSPFALSREEVNLLVSTAESYGMQVIPLVQTFGHLDHILKEPALASIREIHNSPSQLCPRNPASLSYIKGMIDEYCALHPNSKYFHLGGDETRQLGQCPECSAFVRKYGIARLYSDLMNEVIDYICEKGMTPLIYDDMLCAHPETMEYLDKRAVIVYWDYWCTAPQVPHLIARYGDAPVYTYDKRWEDGTWTPEATDVARWVLDVFGEGGCADVEASLGEEFMREYGSYLGDQFPKYFRAFPYLEYYMDHGFKVIGMPTSLGNTDNYLGMPNQARFAANVRVCCERVAEAGAMGVITSAWHFFPSPAYPLGISTAAHYSWGLADYASSVPDWR